MPQAQQLGKGFAFSSSSSSFVFVSPLPFSTSVLLALSEILLSEEEVTQQIEALRFVDIARTTKNDFPLQFAMETFFKRYSILINISAPLRNEKRVTAELCWKLLQLLERGANMDNESRWSQVGDLVVSFSIICFSASL